MRMLITILALLTFGSVAAAQTTGTGSPTPQASSSKPAQEAPVGHRQPRADQVPSAKNLGDPNDPVNREDAMLDKKIKSICRGC